MSYNSRVRVVPRVDPHARARSSMMGAPMRLPPRTRVTTLHTGLNQRIQSTKPSPLSLSLSLCATRHERGFASSTGCSWKGSTNTPSANAAAVYTSRTLEKSRTLQADSSENRERRSRPLRTFETVSVETGFHIIRLGNAATQRILLDCSQTSIVVACSGETRPQRVWPPISPKYTRLPLRARTRITHPAFRDSGLT